MADEGSSVAEIPDGPDGELARALETCASEPVHIPGCVQPFACLIGVHAATGRIDYASENCRDILGLSSTSLLGAHLNDIFGSEIPHAIRTAASRPDFARDATAVGDFRFGDGYIELSAFASGEIHVLQIEPVTDPNLGGGDALATLAHLMQQVQTCTDQKRLFDLSTRTLRHLSGYDRVTVYKFDPQFNGEIIAEAKSPAMEPYLGLRFPHWDIPRQAREIMAKLPLRFIEDVDQAPIQLIARVPSLPPLDITFAETRGVSAVHMQYLRNAKLRSTMTLTVMIEGALWGIISFHHRRPRVPAPKLRQILKAYLELFSTKLASLIKQAQLDKIDIINSQVLQDIDVDQSMEDAMNRIAPVIMDMLDSNGVALLAGSQTISVGQTPERAVLTHLLSEARAQVGRPIITNSLAERYPDLSDGLNECAGVLASAQASNRAFCIFRPEGARSVMWAGNPDKQIVREAGQIQLAPRASFSAYLQEMEGCSAQWTKEDVYFAERIWVLINSAERRALKNALTRQQSIMIDELNHRVRNILALVRSVSRQARRHYSSLDSYSASLENRIQALAASHDIASGSDVASVDILKLIAVETDPFQIDGRISITGSEHFLRADIAPIFSLVMHELATNAAKYGALSTTAGTVAVKVWDAPGGVAVFWQERGGPPVSIPNERGFGSTLIDQAIPHEMGGTADLRFEPAGVEATFFFPDDVLDMAQGANARRQSAGQKAIPLIAENELPPGSVSGTVLVLEDNFVIAQDMYDQLSGIGVKQIELCGNAGDAMDILNSGPVAFAVLDVNLGPGKTSEGVALHLIENRVPFIFVTGYGDKAKLEGALKDVPRLTKPVATRELQDVMIRMLSKS